MNRKIILIITVLLLLFISSSAFASGDMNEDPLDEVFDVLKRNYVNMDDLQSQITKYKSSNYYLDIKNYSSLLNPIKKLTSNVNSINNLLFGLNKTIAKLTIILLLFAYKVDLFKMLGVQIDMIIDALKVPIFDKTILTVIAFIGLYSIAAAIFADRKTTVLNATVRTLIIVTIALIFMSNPSGYLTKMNDISIEVSDELFRSTYGRYKKIPDSEDGLVSAGSMLWDVMVHKPWETLVLGTTDDRLTDSILSKEPFDDARIDIIDDLSEDQALLRLEGIFPRFGSLIIFTAFNLVLAAIVILVSAASIFAQTMVVAFSFIAPIVFLISLIPRFSDSLGAWALRISGYAFIKIAISLILALILVINAAIFANISTNGLVITLILMSAVTFAIYQSRDKILGVIKAVPKGERQIRRELKSPSGITERVKDYQNIITGYGREKTKAETEKRWPSGVKYMENPADMNSRNDRNDTEYENYKKLANEYLNKQYEEQKTNAEVKAERLGIDNARYSEFVTNADTRVTLGEEMFTEAQVNYVIKLIKRVEADGEDVDKFIKGEVENTIKNPTEINRKLNVQGDTASLNNKELNNRIGMLQNEINKRREELNNKDLSPEERNKESFEVYKLWQQKYELQNALQERKLSSKDKTYSHYNEYKELGEVRENINSNLLEMAKVFTDENFEGDRYEAFNKHLDIQVNLRTKEDELINKLESKRELTDIRNQAQEQERKILEHFDIDKIKSNSMLINEKEDYTRELDKLSSIYEAENMKVREMKESGIKVKDLNRELLEKLISTKGSDTEKLLLARAELSLSGESKFKLEGPQESVNTNKVKTEVEKTVKINENAAKTNESASEGSKVVEKIIEKPLRIDQKLDIDKLNQRDEEIISEINKLKIDQFPSKNQTIRIEGEQLEKLGEEIARNFERADVQNGSNVVQSITQDIVLKSAAELNDDFSNHFGLGNNQVFFENLINKYGSESIQAEIEEMKQHNDIRNPKGLLITRLKNNNKEG